MQNIPREWLESIAKNAEAAVIILDKQRTIQYANDAAVRMAERSGKATSDLIGTSYDDILTLSVIRDEEGNRASIESFPTYLALHEGKETVSKLFEQVYNLRHYWLSVSCVPLFNANGEVEHVLAYLLDLSESKLRQDRLAFLVASSKISSVQSVPETLVIEKVRLLMPSLADWCAIDRVDPDGAFVRLFTLSHGDHAPSIDETGFIPWKPESATCMDMVIASGKSELYSVLRQKERFREVVPQQCLPLVHGLEAGSLMVIPIKANGVVVGALSLAYTTSGRHYTQDDLEFMEDFCHHLGLIIDNTRLYRELEKSSKAKDVFLAALSHELRNPLAAIKISIELLKMEQQEQEGQERLSVIEHQFDHITSLLNDLLDVNRYSFGKIKLRRERISLTQDIQRVVKANQALVDEKHLHLTCTLPDGDIMIWADPTRIEQAVMNLLHNAVKFTPEGGTITIEVREEDGQVVVNVADTGIGMEPEDAKHAFEGDLHQGEGKSPTSGLGLGLVLVREIVHLHGGEVWAKSEGLGKGSTFTIKLPLGMREGE